MGAGAAGGGGMSLLVFGRSGQVAQELARRVPAARFVGRETLDIGDLGALGAALPGLLDGADAVINAAAWTAVDKAETEEEAARRVNGDAPTLMARAAAERGLPFVHISTDYVFDGQGREPFRPDSPLAPQNAYGRSKLAGEEGVRAAGGRHVILRTSWVFSAHGANFVRTMLRLGREREEVRVVDDQVGGPTPAAAIAEACLGVARGLREGREGGTHHFSGAPDVSWADFAEAVMDEAGLACRVVRIPSSEFPTPAKRPLNSRMDGGSLERAFGIARPDWRAGLRDVLRELGA